jgi:hypothetical protein
MGVEERIDQGSNPGSVIVAVVHVADVRMGVHETIVLVLV